MTRMIFPKLLFYIMIAFIIYVMMAAVGIRVPPIKPDYSNYDGFYWLVPISKTFSFGYLVSSNLYASLDQKSVEKTFLHFVQQSKVPTPYYPQLMPLAYIIRIRSQFYQIMYNLTYPSDKAVGLRYISKNTSFIKHTPKMYIDFKMRTAFLPIPHGQIFEYKREQMLTFAICHSNITNIYLTHLNSRKLIRLKYQPLGLDQLQHQRWVFFSDKDSHRLLAIINIQPHVVVAIDKRTGITEDYARTSQQDLFAAWRGQQVFMGSAPIHLPQENLYLGVFHTSAQINIFYTFSSTYPYEIKCIILPSAVRERLFRRPITEIRLVSGMVYTLAGYSIPLSRLLNEMQNKCAQKSVPKRSISLQWFPSVLPSSFDIIPYLYNPAVLKLPRSSLYPYLAAGRSRYEARENYVVHPVTGKYIAPQSWSTLVACLMDNNFSCIHTPRELHIYFPIRGIVQQLGTSSATVHNFVGPEDPRLIWTENRVPLLIYGMNALESAHKKKKMPVRVVWMIDVRHVFQQLTVVLPNDYAERPFYTGKYGVQLNYGSEAWEKNWMPFIHESRMLIGYSVEPKISIQKKMTEVNSESLLWFFHISAVSRQKIQQLYSETKYEEMFQPKKYNERLDLDFIHQGPNALFIVTEKESFFITILHQRVILYDKKKDPVSGFKMKHYMHYVALFDSKAPYRWMAMSRHNVDSTFSAQLGVSNRNRQYIFVTTIAFDDPNDIENGYGTFDSRIIVSYGLGDCRSYVWIGVVSELMDNMKKID